LNEERKEVKGEEKGTEGRDQRQRKGEWKKGGREISEGAVKRGEGREERRKKGEGGGKMKEGGLWIWK